jgi:hypothetical protein
VTTDMLSGSTFHELQCPSICDPFQVLLTSSAESGALPDVELVLASFLKTGSSLADATAAAAARWDPSWLILKPR